jgi:hypothetical protein
LTLLKPMTIAITPRDLEILQALATARYLTAPQIQALYWRARKGGEYGTLKACQRRLRLLTTHALLRRIDQPVRRGEGPRPYIYALDRAGAELVSQELGLALEELDWKSKAAEANYPFMEHLLATHDFRIALTRACETHGFTLETWLDEKVLKQEEMRDYVLLKSVSGAAQRVAVIPDAFFVLKTAQRIGRFCLEIDRGMVTVAPKSAERGWTQKIRAYLEHQASGLYERRYQSRNLWVLTVTTSERRLLHLKQATEEVGGDHRFWFTTFAQIAQKRLSSQNVVQEVLYNAGLLTEPIWYQAGSNRLHRLLE